MSYAPWDETTRLLWPLIRREVAVLQVLLIDLLRVHAKRQGQVTLISLMRRQSILLASQMNLKLALFLKVYPLNATLDDSAKVKYRLELILGALIEDGR